MGDQQIITTTDVAITQMAIEVKVMKIGNRQVTLAVFKQLPAEPIIDRSTGELRGIAWGRVNYHVGCVETWKHLHVVWQKGNELRRSVALAWDNRYSADGNRSYKENWVNSDDYYRLQSAWDWSYHQLEELDQLFIAV